MTPGSGLHFPGFGGFRLRVRQAEDFWGKRAARNGRGLALIIKGILKRVYKGSIVGFLKPNHGVWGSGSRVHGHRALAQARGLRLELFMDLKLRLCKRSPLQGVP